MLKVYRVRTDVNQYQFFMPKDKKDELIFYLDCLPMSNDWVPPPVYVYMPKLKEGDFWNFNGGTLITNPKVTKELRPHLEHAGELLPLPYNDEIYTVLNVTECINCLDQENTEWRYGKTTGAKIGIKKYAFHGDRFSESDIFKIPETCKSELLVVEGRKDAEDEFKYTVESLGLKGLIFELIWEG